MGTEHHKHKGPCTESEMDHRDGSQTYGPMFIRRFSCQCGACGIPWNSCHHLSSSVIYFLPPFSPVSSIFQVASVPLEMLVRQGHQVAKIEGEHAVLEPLTGLGSGSHWELGLGSAMFGMFGARI